MEEKKDKRKRKTREIYLPKEVVKVEKDPKKKNYIGPNDKVEFRG